MAHSHEGRRGLGVPGRQHPCYIPHMHNSISADQLLRELALAVARNNVGALRPVSEVIAGEGLTQAEYDAISLNPQFQRYVETYAAELKESGFSIQAKSRLLVEDLLPTMYHLVKDVDAPAAARVKAFENFIDLAGAKPNKAVEATAGPGFSITINVPSGALTASSTKALSSADVTELPVITLPTRDKRAPTNIVFDEPDSYEYAGEDFYS